MRNSLVDILPISLVVKEMRNLNKKNGFRLENGQLQLPTKESIYKVVHSLVLSSIQMALRLVKT